jgi:hypothetical protein
MLQTGQPLRLETPFSLLARSAISLVWAPLCAESAGRMDATVETAMDVSDSLVTVPSRGVHSDGHSDVHMAENKNLFLDSVL